MQQQPKTKWLTIKTGTGRVTGYIEGFWCTTAKCYVTVPGVSRFLDASQPERYFDGLADRLGIDLPSCR